jgi:hypothetical protein
VNQPVPVQVAQGFRQRQADFQHPRGWQTAVPQIRPQRVRNVRRDGVLELWRAEVIGTAPAAIRLPQGRVP